MVNMSPHFHGITGEVVGSEIWRVSFKGKTSKGCWETERLGGRGGLLCREREGKGLGARVKRGNKMGAEKGKPPFGVAAGLTAHSPRAHPRSCSQASQCSESSAGGSPAQPQVAAGLRRQSRPWWMPCRLVELRSPCGPLDPFLRTEQRNFWLIYVPLGCPKTEVLTAPKRLQLREHPRVLHPRSVRCQFYSASEALG